MNRKIVFVILLSVFFAQVAYAEGKKSISDFGDGAYGANRRVQTNAGHIAVSGTFSEPEIYVTPSNPAKSKPTYYFGSDGANVKTEGGVQYESARLIVNGVTYEPGWSFFVRTPEITLYQNGQPVLDAEGNPVKSGWTSPKVNGRGVRVAKGGLGNVTMTYSVTRRGGIYLRVNGGITLGFWGNPNDSQTYHSWYPTYDGTITNAALTAIKMRRIIGITQAKPKKGYYEIDHSKSINNNFTNGNIAKPSWINGDPELKDNQLKYNWQASWNSVDQSASGTGYYPGGKDKTGDWIFDFSFTGVGNRDSAGNYRDTPTPARYNAESINVNLKRWGAANRGKDLKGDK